MNKNHEKEAKQIVRDIYLFAQNWTGKLEVFEQMVSPSFIDRIINLSKTK